MLALQFFMTVSVLPMTATRWILGLQVLFVALSPFWCLVAISEELQIEVAGMFIRNEQYNESFGSTESELPISVSFAMDKSEGVHLSSVAPLDRW